MGGGEAAVAAALGDEDDVGEGDDGGEGDGGLVFSTGEPRNLTLTNSFPCPVVVYNVTLPALHAKHFKVTPATRQRQTNTAIVAWCLWLISSNTG